jgi:hypothetical protein
MKAGLRIALGIAAAIAIVIVGLCAAWSLWGRHLWAPGMMGMAGQYAEKGETVSWEIQSGRTQRQEAAGTIKKESPSLLNRALTIDQIQKAVEAYIQNLGHPDLEIAEVIEFEQSFYVILREHDTGIGAMELLVDKITGEVGPEIGPNMMWNARYGTHRRGGMMMGRSGEVNVLSQEQAVEIAQRWLNVNRPGVSAEQQVDPFYGYYAIHTTENGQIEGMLSVHGTTGQVWYHFWHGAFIQMLQGTQDHD